MLTVFIKEEGFRFSSVVARSYAIDLKFSGPVQFFYQYYFFNRKLLFPLLNIRNVGHD